MKVDEVMLSAMSKCSTLQRVCIIAKNGTMDTEGVKELFEKVFKIFSNSLFHYTSYLNFFQFLSFYMLIFCLGQIYIHVLGNV